MAVACAALLSCSKETANVVDANHFEKGQNVTFTVKAGDSSTRVSSELNAVTSEVDFKWQTGDKINVTVGGDTAHFTLIGDGGSNEGTFEGEMPADGSTFSVQYPVEKPTLTTQDYSSSEALSRDKMLFTAKDCSLCDPKLELQARYTALRLNFYGSSQDVSKIVVTNKANSATYTLNISPAVTLSTDSENPTPFFVVVPAGTYKFSAEVTGAGTGSGTPPAVIITFSNYTLNTLTAGTVLNMPAKEVKAMGWS